MQALTGLGPRHLDQVLELQDAALAGLEGFAVGPVHGPEADVLQFALGGVAGQIGGAEDDLEVVGLPLVDAVDHRLRVEGLAPVEDGGEVGRAVHRRALGGDDKKGRQLAFVTLPGDADDAGALVVDQEALGVEFGHHGRDQVVDVALALPPVEVDAERMEVAFKGDLGDDPEPLPEHVVARRMVLQLGGDLAGAVAEIGVGLGPRGRGRVEVAQVVEAKLRKLVEPRVVVGRRGSPRVHRFDEGADFGVGVTDRGDQQAHLEAPVPEVGVTDDLVAAEAVEALDGLADDRGAQVTDVHLLGDVGAAVVDDHAPRGRDGLGAGAGVRGDGVGALGEGRVGELQVDEAGAGDVDAGEARVALQPLGHGGGDLARVLAHALGGGQRAVRLEVGQIGSVGRGDPAQSRGQPFGGEGGLDRFAERRLQVAHGVVAAAVAWPTLSRKRLPSRLKAAICGVTSKPIRISKLAPEVVVSARGMVISPNFSRM